MTCRLAVLAVARPFRLAAFAVAQTPSHAEFHPHIQDNRFLVEEAYNQDDGVVQHIHQFAWTRGTGDWLATFTQAAIGRRDGDGEAVLPDTGEGLPQQGESVDRPVVRCAGVVVWIRIRSVRAISDRRFVDVAPAPGLTRLERADDRVFRRVEVLRGVAIR